MRFALFVAFFVVTLTTLLALPYETNADRLARGLPPLPPVRRSPSAARAAEKPKPSSGGGTCGGISWCCKSVYDHDEVSHKGLLGWILGLLGLGKLEEGLVGLECVLLGKGICPQPVCCTGAHLGGTICSGCSRL